MRSHRREAMQEVEELIGLVGEAPGVTLVLVENELEPDSTGSGLSVVRPSRRRTKPGTTVKAPGRRRGGGYDRGGSSPG
jgi:hypothetical protein